MKKNTRQGIVRRIIEGITPAIDKALNERKKVTYDIDEVFKIPYKKLDGSYPTITRGDYESLPCAMIACDWTDGQMMRLANEIAEQLKDNDFDEDDMDKYEEEFDDAFWEEMEVCATRLGMRYYEDLDDEEYEEYQNDDE